MNKRLIANEFKSSLGQFIFFTVLIISTLVAAFMLHPYITDDMVISISKLNSYLKTILYLNDNILDSKEYYAFVMQYFIIIGSIMAIHVSTKQILWDRKEGYDEYLFTLPVSRGAIFKNKCICILIELLIFNVIFCISSILLSSLSSFHIGVKYILQMNSALMLAQLTFAAIGFLMGALIRHPKFIYVKSTIVLFILLIIAIPERIYNIKLLKYINPFSYLNLRDLLIKGEYKYSFIIASGFIVIFSITISKSIYDEYDTFKM